MKQVTLALIATAVATPAVAAEFYIVRDGDDKECRIVETRPAEKTIVVVGDRTYVTREEAEKDLAVVCKDD
jgi:hypothetical protein